MTYTYKAGMLTLKKVTGQSDCDNMVMGKYKIVFIGTTFKAIAADDNCADRLMALNNTAWVKQ